MITVMIIALIVGVIVGFLHIYIQFKKLNKIGQREQNFQNEISKVIDTLSELNSTPSPSVSEGEIENWLKSEYNEQLIQANSKILAQIIARAIKELLNQKR